MIELDYLRAIRKDFPTHDQFWAHFDSEREEEPFPTLLEPATSPGMWLGRAILELDLASLVQPAVRDGDPIEVRRPPNLTSSRAFLPTLCILCKLAGVALVRTKTGTELIGRRSSLACLQTALLQVQDNLRLTFEILPTPPTMGRATFCRSLSRASEEALLPRLWVDSDSALREELRQSYRTRQVREEREALTKVKHYIAAGNPRLRDWEAPGEIELHPKTPEAILGGSLWELQLYQTGQYKVLCK